MLSASQSDALSNTPAGWAGRVAPGLADGLGSGCSMGWVSMISSACAIVIWVETPELVLAHVAPLASIPLTEHGLVGGTVTHPIIVKIVKLRALMHELGEVRRGSGECLLVFT